MYECNFWVFYSELVQRTESGSIRTCTMNEGENGFHGGAFQEWNERVLNYKRFCVNEINAFSYVTQFDLHLGGAAGCLTVLEGDVSNPNVMQTYGYGHDKENVYWRQ